MIDYSSSQIASNRAALYHWFAQVIIAPPTVNEVTNMRDGKTRQLINALAATPGASAGVKAMNEVLASGTPVEVTAALGAAHSRLFYGVGGHQTAPLYRSVYSSERGLVCQQATAEMERVLRQHRLRLKDDVCEPSDHLGIQLEVMAQLALRFAESAQQSSATLATMQVEQADFLVAQLLSWLPALSQRVIEVDELGFHAGLVCTLQAVLDQDLAFLTQTNETSA
jgi:TorA-specific chaperone